MNKFVELKICNYINNTLEVEREVKFKITEECLNDYLTETEDNRTVNEFLETCDSDESSVIYEYANDDGRILSEEITYCDKFIEKYEDFVRRIQMFDPDMTAEEIATKEDYYWQCWCLSDGYCEEINSLYVEAEMIPEEELKDEVSSMISKILKAYDNKQITESEKDKLINMLQ